MRDEKILEILKRHENDWDKNDQEILHAYKRNLEKNIAKKIMELNSNPELKSMTATATYTKNTLRKKRQSG